MAIAATHWIAGGRQTYALPTPDHSETTMTTRKEGPPVPPAGRNPKGTGADPASRNPGAKGQPIIKDTGQNLREQGQHCNIHQNMHNQVNPRAR